MKKKKKNTQTQIVWPASRKSRNFSGAFRIWGDIILFTLSSKWRSLEERKFAFILIFIPFTKYEKTGFIE